MKSIVPSSACRVALVVAAAVAAAACVPREWLMPTLGLETPAFRDFGPGFKPPLSVETDQPITGFGGNGGGVTRTPFVFVHGTTVSPSFWKGARAHFRELGYTDDELWAVGYGWNNGRYFDVDQLSAVTLDRFVTAMLTYLSEKEDRPVRQLDMMGHSLGNTVIRHWVTQTNSWHKLRSFIGNSGVNHGSWALTADVRGPNRAPGYELHRDSPWLKALNRAGETPGPTHYMTLYDGTGWGDIFYSPPYKDSPRLEGARNLAYNVEHGTLLDHLELGLAPGPLAAVLEFVRTGPEPTAGAEPPQILQEGAVLKTDQERALLFCAKGGAYPAVAAAGTDYPTVVTLGAPQVDLSDEELHTCFAQNTKTRLSSPMARFKYSEAPRSNEPLTLTATPGGGVFEHPQRVTLKTSDPAAFIVYSTVTADVNSGMPLYFEPVYVHAPLTLTAVAYAPDGRVTEPLKLQFDISQELIDARNTLQRQFDPSAPVEYAGRRKKGR